MQEIAPQAKTPQSAAFLDDLPPGWQARLSPETQKPYFQQLSAFLQAEDASGQTIYPARENVFRALREVDFEQVRVVILGQDPYHGADQAMGLAFAVPNELRPKPPSLVNIGKEIASDLGVSMEGQGSELSGWVRQGVLLLNTVLTVRAGEAFSHRNQGWETFTDHVIHCLDEREEPIVFLLWGAAALKKKQLLKCGRHLVLESVHPSPLSAHRGFFGCRHFSKANAQLVKQGRPPIDWAQTTSA
jgi:uracil-DNA glycosylase